MSRQLLGAAWILAGAVVLCGCSRGDGQPAEPEGEPVAPPATGYGRATAYIDPASGSDVVGTAIFFHDRAKSTVDLQVNIEGAPPGKHAIHIHEHGDCSAEDGSSAGGHWNPTAEDHGQWGQAPFHLGDIGNVEVGADGKGALTLSTDKWAVGTGETHDVVGKSVIVHEKADDFKTQPTGAAGGRIACGVIKSN